METKTEQESALRYHGIGIGNGCVGGKLRFLSKRSSCKNTDERMNMSGTDALAEERRFFDACMQTKERLGKLQRLAAKEIGSSEAEIFRIHAVMLEDEEFRNAVRTEIAGGALAETAVERAADKYATALRDIGDSYLSARAADLYDISAQLVQCLLGEETDGVCSGEREPFILVADDLSPSETVSLEKSLILGFVTFGGSLNSHTSILARAMGIPALVGVGAVPKTCNSTYALLDAGNGTLTVSPDEKERYAFENMQRKINEAECDYDREMQLFIREPAITRNGRRILICANIGKEHEIASALSGGADGVGLLRSEFLYLSLDRYPTEQELFQKYHDVVQNMQGKRIVIRTLDIGADKKPPYFEFPSEANPALGFRGVRVCLSRRALFKTQLRAILRASAFGNVSLMIPMIVSPEEVRVCRALLEICMKELRQEGIQFDEGIEFGVMIETPAAAMMSEEIAREADFFSVGSNDLTQYTLAADRQNPSVAHICKENCEPVLRLIRMASNAIHRHGGWIGVCGELAADLLLTQRWIDMGIDELSVSVPYLLGVRKKVTECQ